MADHKLNSEELIQALQANALRDIEGRELVPLGTLKRPVRLEPLGDADLGRSRS